MSARDRARTGSLLSLFLFLPGCMPEIEVTVGEKSDGTITVQQILDLTHQLAPAINPPPGFNNPEEIRLLLKSATKVVD